MDYWAAVMQDDVYLIAAEGWQEAAKPRGIIQDKERKIKEEADLTVGKQKYKTDLIPPDLIIDHYFQQEKQQLEQLQAKHESLSHELNEYTEEHATDEGLLADVLNDKGNVTKGAVQDRLKELGKTPDEEFLEEHQALTHVLQLTEQEAKAKKAVNDHQKDLDKKVLAQYDKLTEEEIKTLVVDHKWFANIQKGIQSEVTGLIQQLTTRIQTLHERYAIPLPDLEQSVTDYSQKVEEHLKKMGV
jgi:type I restriction enzyme M protein